MVSDAVAAETKRITTITSLIGCDKVKSKAIEDGLTVGDTAIELNGTVVATQTKDKKDFEDAAAELSGNDQLPNGSEQVSAEALAIEADDKKYYENKKGK